MTNNTWAYSTDDINYQGVPTLDSPVLLSDIDGISTGTNTNGVVSATIPIYYAAKVDTFIPSGSYANSVTYLAVVDGGIITNATLTKIEVDGAEVENMQPEVENTLEITTNLMTNTYGTPRVYYETTSPAGYQECGDVVVSRNESGYMTIICKVTPTQAATGVTLHVVPKGSSDDRLCTDNTYQPDTSDCEAGEWRWGSFTVSLPDIVTPAPDINRPATSWDDLEIMQHMTPEICASASEGDTKQLIDWRDGKTYWVAKLKDGNCWMTQNLELDLSTDTPLTSELSDVASSWTPTNSTYTSAQDGTSDPALAQSWNLGKVVWRTSVSDGWWCEPRDNLYNPSCTSYWQNVSDANSWFPMTEYRSDGIMIEGNTYDAHYLAGNYYSFQAATAGSAPSHGTASGSICPKGFTLPTSNMTVNGSFPNLITQTSANANTIVQAPLMFVRGGYALSGDYLERSNAAGLYWSSIGNSSDFAYYLLFYTSDEVDPSTSRHRSVGLSVRCVAVSSQS